MNHLQKIFNNLALSYIGYIEYNLILEYKIKGWQESEFKTGVDILINSGLVSLYDGKICINETVKKIYDVNYEKGFCESKDIYVSVGFMKPKKETKEVINEEYEDELINILIAWNKSLSINNRPTKSLMNEYSKLRKTYETDDLLQAMKKYVLYKKENSWLTHTFSLFDFLKQKNGFLKYYNM